MWDLLHPTLFRGADHPALQKLLPVSARVGAQDPPAMWKSVACYPLYFLSLKGGVDPSGDRSGPRSYFQDNSWVALGASSAEGAPSSIFVSHVPSLGCEAWIPPAPPPRSGHQALPEPRVPGLPPPSPPEGCCGNGKRCPGFIGERMK